MADSDRSRGLCRRDVLALGVGAFVVAAIPFAARGRRRLVRRTVPVMGTLADLAVVHDDTPAAHAALDAAVERLRAVDRMMTRHAATSDLGRANRLAFGEAVPVDRETAYVLEAALAWAAATDGAFDPCLGRAAAAWEVTEHTEPPAADVRRSLARAGLWRALDVDTWRGAPAVRLADEAAALDLGGIAKGYGVDRAVAALREHGIEHALVNVGGDLYALGASEDGDPWRVGIRAPDDPSALLGSLDVRDEAVATSGDYERRFTYAGRTYSHLLDPRTGAPRVTDVHSVSVRASTCMAADAGATAAFGLDPDAAARAFARVAPDARIVSTA